MTIKTREELFSAMMNGSLIRLGDDFGVIHAIALEDSSMYKFNIKLTTSDGPKTLFIDTSPKSTINIVENIHGTKVAFKNIEDANKYSEYQNKDHGKPGETYSWVEIIQLF